MLPTVVYTLCSRKDAVMALDLKPTSKWWYARLRKGKRLMTFPLTRVVGGRELRIEVKGERPTSLRTLEGADALFMESYRQAKAAHDQLQEELKSRATVTELTNRIAKAHTGQRIELERLNTIPEKWAGFPREMKLSQSHKRSGQRVLKSFVSFIHERWPECEYLLDVRPDQIAAFMEKESNRGVSPRTWNLALGLLKHVFKELAPSSDAYNLYLSKTKRRRLNTVHREPFTTEEISRILAEARKDEILRGPVHVACFTALRKGDACQLKWDAVDMKAGTIRTRTAKTGEWVEIPILPTLAEELKNCKRADSEYLFEKAAILYTSPSGESQLDKRFKGILRAAGFAKDLDKAASSRPPLPKLSPEDTRKRAVAALDGSGFQDRKKEKMLAVLDAYLEGATLPDIAKDLKVSKSTVSLHLNTLEELCRCAIFRHRGPSPVTGATEVLETSEGGDRLKRGSRYGWHSFRTTFITQALSAGMPEELVRRVTGHSAVDIVRKHYFRPNQETFRKEFARVADGFYQTEVEAPAAPDLDAIRAIVEKMTARSLKQDKAQLLELLGPADKAVTSAKA
jgi:integrase